VQFGTGGEEQVLVEVEVVGVLPFFGIYLFGSCINLQVEKQVLFGTECRVPQVLVKTFVVLVVKRFVVFS